MTCGIYKLENIKNFNIYIGSAKNIKNRWNTHIRMLNSGTHHSKHLQNAWNVYGSDSFYFSILLECDEKDLIHNEQIFIDALNPAYNISKTAGSKLGIKDSYETKKKKSEAAKKYKHPSGWHHSHKTKLAISIFNVGKVVSQETKNRMSASAKGKIKSDQHKHNLSISHTGKIVSDETKKKISEIQKKIPHKRGWSHKQESKDKMSKSKMGHGCSAETKLKLSKAAKLQWEKYREHKLNEK